MSRAPHRPLKVLHVLDRLLPSGGEVCLRVAAPHWDALGVEAEILSVGAEAGTYAPVLARAGYPIHHLPQRPMRAFAPAFARLVRRGRFDVVQLHVERANFYNAAVARAAGACTVVVVVHNTFRFRGGLQLERRIQRRLMRAAGVRFVAVGSSVQRTEAERFGNPTQRIVNWYDEDTFRPASAEERRALRAELGIPAAEPVLATVGKCSPVKNHEALIDALGRLGPEQPFTYLHLGAEQEGHPERQLARARGIGDRCRFLGAVDGVDRYLRAADLYVMPSLHEGLSIATLEAVGSGLRAVLADVPGLRDMGEHPLQISWVQPTASSLETGLREALAVPFDPAAAQRQAAVARAAYGSERGAREYVDLYRSAAPQPEGAPA